MRRPLTRALFGLFVALSSSSLLYGQQIQPTSYEDLVSRLEAVESGLAQYESSAQYSGGGETAQPYCCDPSCGVRGGFFATYENVWVQPYFNHNGAYQVFDAIGNIPESVQIVEFDWDFEYTPRVEFGYISPCSGFGWRARYWQFDRRH